MNTTESITWTSKKTWGVVGLAHRAEVTIGDDTYCFTVDQPRKGYWVARGWKNGTSCLYRDGSTLARMKDAVAAEVIGLKVQQARELKAAADQTWADLAEAAAQDDLAEQAEADECWCHWVDIGVGEQRAADVAGCPQHCPYADVPLDDWTDPEALDPLPATDATAEIEQAEDGECWCEVEPLDDGTVLVHVTGGCPQHDPYLPEDVCRLCMHVDCLPTCSEYRGVQLQPFEGVQRAFASLAELRAAHRDAVLAALDEIESAAGPELAPNEFLHEGEVWVIEATQVTDEPQLPCVCPTPTHRMSCGVGATPKVVRS